ncbi:MAG: hypothetical protein COA84_01290 [Robiginitomaculum sp.]|nr:MAG: hypothetical protein COA84_01290 [Robiginitomaculum sp.]
MINSGDSIARSCSISLRKAGQPINISYRAMEADNATAAAATDTPVDIAPGAAQAFVLSFTASAPVPAGTLRLTYACSDDAGAKVEAPVVDGVNALSFSASATPSPDVVTNAQSRSVDGYVRILTSGGAEAMAISAVNIGAGTNGKAEEADLIAMPDTGNVALPASLFVCETEPTTGACLSDPAPFIHTKVGATLKTYTVFANADPEAGIPEFPDLSRVYLRFYEESAPLSDERGEGRGATGMALTAPAPASSDGQTSSLPEGIWEARFNSTNGGYNEGLLFISAAGALNAIIYSDGNGNHDGGGEGDNNNAGNNNNGDASGDNGSSDNHNGNGDSNNDGNDSNDDNGSGDNGNGSGDNGDGSGDNGNGSGDNDGDGDGSGDNDGDGDGNGSGDNGNGSGDNDGDGDGSGDNDGDGDGNGSGDNGNGSGDNDGDGDGNGSGDNDNDDDGNNSENRAASATLFAGTISTDGSGGWTANAKVLDLSNTVGGVAYQLGGNWDAKSSLTGTYVPSTGSTTASIGTGSLRAAFSRDYDRSTVIADLGGSFDFYDGNTDIGDLTVSSAGTFSGTYAFPGSAQVCNVSGDFTSSGASANLYSVTVSLQNCASAGSYSGQATLRVEDDNRSSTVNPIQGMAMTADSNRGMVLDLFPKGHVRSNDR